MAHALRYVVLHHTGYGQAHFDLMFETAEGSPLATWRHSSWPLQDGDDIEHLADHRPAYLDYEGPVSNNRGQVRRVQSGYHTVLFDEPDQLMVRLEDGTELLLGKSPKATVVVTRA